MSRVGISNLHYAKMTSDTVAGAIYNAPVALPNVMSLDRKVGANSETLYADNGPAEINETLGEITVAVNVIELTLEQKADLLGHSIVGGVMVSHVDDVAPYVALMFEGLKTNGKKRLKKLLKGKASELDENYQSKSDKPNPQTDTINFKFLKRDFDGLWEKTADEESPGYVSSIGTNWYTAVEPDADVIAPTVTCVPVDSATNVAADADVVLTFSEAMTTSTLVVGESFILQKSDGTQVAGAGAWNTGHTVYTFNPTASLTAGATYNVLVTKAVKDLAGVALAAVNEFTFTVAA